MAAGKNSKFVSRNSALQSKWVEEHFVVCMMSVPLCLGFNESGS
jgi:hypothetical protein